jgi:hypothetical protein
VREAAVTKNGKNCTENVRATRSITLNWAIRNSLASTKEKASLMRPFMLIESKIDHYNLNLLLPDINEVIKGLVLP